MPTVLRWRGFRFHFYSDEGSEPPHIHVWKAGLKAKFWLNPVALSDNSGFDEREINAIRRKVEEQQTVFLGAWNGYFGV